ncbi:hypothetical protein F5Y15DRAFT_42205 [Xylariaceae sp. FL0016]|nr:hypothetical protein F5Y15DRAFT_42205 [Xylariaceae sp. FL0016]
MRTRRQNKVTKAVETESASASAAASENIEESPVLTPDPAPASASASVPVPVSPTPSSPASKTVVTLSKVEGPNVTEGALISDQPKMSKIPEPLQFPLVAILSLAFSAVGYGLTWSFTRGVLAEHTRLLDTWAEVGAVTGWRIFELALGWFGNFDGYDLTALNLLSHGPPLYLLFAHYEAPATALLSIVTIETLAAYIPFRLLRPLSTMHARPSSVPNADIITDPGIILATTALAGAIYSVSLLFAYATYLPTYLVVYFAGLPSLVRAHDASYIGLMPVTLALGFAARLFIFTPAEATGRTPQDDENEKFDPVAASLRETVWWNVWGWSSQTKTVMRRTALLMLVTGINTFLQTRMTVRGVETPGAAAWSSVWVLAAAITGLGMGAVGSP